MNNLTGKGVLKLELNTNIIKNAAEHKLRDLRRTSFSDEGFSAEEVSTIAEAISAAIAEYDRQRNQET